MGATGLAGFVERRIPWWASNSSKVWGLPPWHVSQPTALRPWAD